MIGKVDLVMWARDGAKTLPLVLRRIEKVIPHSHVNNKILVDDHSTDRTREIARDFEWSVYLNPKGGIGFGANEALRHVEAEYFVSVEQDVLLSNDWWAKITKHMANRDVVVAQGIRVFSNDVLRKLDNTYSPQNPNPYSVDNNLYRTQFLLDTGGFPIDTLAVDALLFRRVEKMGKLWIIDKTVVGQHLKGSLIDFLRSQRKSYSLPTVLRIQPPALKKLVRLLVTSPFRGLHLSFSRHCPSLFWFYPSYRLMVLLGLIQGRSNSFSQNILYSPESLV